jgi:hypothetical protein
MDHGSQSLSDLRQMSIAKTRAQQDKPTAASSIAAAVPAAGLQQQRRPGREVSTDRYRSLVLGWSILSLAVPPIPHLAHAATGTSVLTWPQLAVVIDNRAALTPWGRAADDTGDRCRCCLARLGVSGHLVLPARDSAAVGGGPSGAAFGRSRRRAGQQPSRDGAWAAAAR